MSTDQTSRADDHGKAEGEHGGHDASKRKAHPLDASVEPDSQVERALRQPANDRAIDDLRAMLLAPVSTHRERR